MNYKAGIWFEKNNYKNLWSHIINEKNCILILVYCWYVQKFHKRFRLLEKEQPSLNYCKAGFRQRQRLVDYWKAILAAHVVCVWWEEGGALPAITGVYPQGDVQKGGFQ